MAFEYSLLKGWWYPYTEKTVPSQLQHRAAKAVVQTMPNIKQFKTL